MEKFDEEGIQKISDLAGDNLTALMDRLDAVTEADKDYTAFDGWKKDADGSVNSLSRQMQSSNCFRKKQGKLFTKDNIRTGRDSGPDIIISELRFAG